MIPIVGPRTVTHLEEYLQAFELEIDIPHHRRLDEVSAIDPGFPHALLASDHIRSETRGSQKIQAARP